MERIKQCICYGIIFGLLFSLTACGKGNEVTTEEVHEPVTYASMEAELLARVVKEQKEKKEMAGSMPKENTEEAGSEAEAATAGISTAEAPTEEATAAENRTEEMTAAENRTGEAEGGEDGTAEGAAKAQKVSGQITFWYNEVQDIEYIRAAAESFEERYGIHVDYILRTDADLLEAVNQANQAGEAPDAYMLPNDLIQKARLAGLAEKNTMYDDQFWVENYPTVSLNALSSGMGVYGYPVYFDTYIMLYDQDYAGEPLTIENILEFSENFVDEENKKEIFRWDISDPFYNFMFLGGYASLLGAAGEDASLFDVTNEYVLQSMTYFQSIHEILSMDMEESSYAKIKKKVKKNKLIYAICKTDILPVLEETENAYKLVKLPKLTDTLDSGSLSITYSACVNPYADSISAATLFSIYLSYEYSGEQFGLSRRISARSSITRENENDQLIFEQYTLSDTIPKALEMGDFWTYSELAFSNIWHGSDVTTELTTLQETIRGRLD